jgi:predicted DNA-binding protein
MTSKEAFATKLPPDLKHSLDEVCHKLGLKKNFVVETAIREKIEDLLDIHDLEEAIKEGTSFRPWQEIKKKWRKKVQR